MVKIKPIQVDDIECSINQKKETKETKQTKETIHTNNFYENLDDKSKCSLWSGITFLLMSSIGLSLYYYFILRT
jgi:hypothetical protein